MQSRSLYVGNEYEKWNATAILEEAYFVHFSDWPLPKPWLSSLGQFEESALKCPPHCPEANALKTVFRTWFEEKDLMRC